MEGKLNYTLVGLFVALLIAAAIVALLWLSGHDKKQQFDLYHVYVTESVTGLNANSTVKYLGVDVGTVANIEINSKNTQQVAIELKIKQGVPIKTDTVATLKFFGITGLAFIELSGSHNDAPLLASSTNAPPIIPYKHSTFKRIEESIDTIVKKTTEVLDRIDRLMGDENLHNISTLLKQSTLLIEDLQVTQKHFDTLIDEGIKVGKSAQKTLDTFNSDVIEQTLTKIGTAADSIDTMADTFSDSGKVMEQNVSDTLKHISAASDSVEKLVTNFGQEYSGVGEKVGNDVDESLRAFRQLLYQLDVVAGDMQRAIDSIEDSPSDLLFKSSKPKLGPGEG